MSCQPNLGPEGVEGGCHSGEEGEDGGGDGGGAGVGVAVVRVAVAGLGGDTEGADLLAAVGAGAAAVGHHLGAEGAWKGQDQDRLPRFSIFNAHLKIARKLKLMSCSLEEC